MIHRSRMVFVPFGDFDNPASPEGEGFKPSPMRIRKGFAADQGCSAP
jgi:hypothetical protein